jgi:hypothetical protein
MTLSATALDIKDKYVDIGEITTPTNPSANFGRLYTKDVGTTHSELFYRDELGTETNVLTGSEITTWTADHDTGGNSLLFTADATPPASGFWISKVGIDMEYHTDGNRLHKFTDGATTVFTISKGDSEVKLGTNIVFNTIGNKIEGLVSTQSIFANSDGWIFNVPTGDDYVFNVNGTSQMELSSGVLSLRTGATSIELANAAEIRLRNSTNTADCVIECVNDFYLLSPSGDSIILGVSGEANSYEFGTTQINMQGNNIDGLGFINFDKIAKPTNPPTEEGRMYLKEIDVNNNGLFIIMQKAGAMTEVQIA